MNTFLPNNLFTYKIQIFLLTTYFHLQYKLSSILIFFFHQEFNRALTKDSSNLQMKHASILTMIRIFKKACFSSAQICLIIFQLGLLEQLQKLMELIFENSDSELFNNILFHMILLINSVLGIPSNPPFHPSPSSLLYLPFPTSPFLPPSLPPSLPLSLPPFLLPPSSFLLKFSYFLDILCFSLGFRTQPHPILKQIANQIGIRLMELADVEEKHTIIRENRNYLKIIMTTLLPRIPKIFLFSNKMILKYILLILLEKILNLAEKNEFLELVDSEK